MTNQVLVRENEQLREELRQCQDKLSVYVDDVRFLKQKMSNALQMISVGDE